MNKRFLTVLVLVVFSLLSLNAISFSSGIDLASIQDLVTDWSDRTSQVTVGISSSVSDSFSLNIPLSITFNERSSLVETGLHLVYHPWKKGPFASMSLVQFGFIAGSDVLEKKSFGLNEVSFGWTFTVLDHLIFEPSLIVRDPSSVFKDDYLALKGEFPCYKSLRFRLMVCWQFWSDKK